MTLPGGRINKFEKGRGGGRPSQPVTGRQTLAVKIPALQDSKPAQQLSGFGAANQLPLM